MYYLFIWDRSRYSESNWQNAVLAKFGIPLDLARILFDLDPTKFPLLSILSASDHDLFGGDELDLLVHELHRVDSMNPVFSDSINSMAKLILEAKSLGQCVLFDPFRE